MEYFPITVQMKDRLCLIVGGGEIAARKLKHLLKANSRIVMVSYEFSEEINQLAKDNPILLIQRSYSEAIFDLAILEHLYLIIAATDDPKINQQVSQNAQARTIWVNVVDDLQLSTFIMPAVIDRSPLLIAVSSSGVSPVLSRMIREKIEWLLPKSLGLLLEKLHILRPLVKKKFNNIKQKREFSEWLLEGVLKDENQLSKDSVIWFDEYKKSLNKSQQGKVYLVGAGPGSADLLTVKALKLLQKADIVLYDALVSDEILDCIRRDATLISVGKRAGSHSVLQQQTNQMLVDYAKQGLSVIRLKGGDPFIFGRGGEELQVLVEQAIEFEVVPGITAASGCASYAGIPLTHRDFSQSVRFVTAHEKDNGENIDWPGLAIKNQTLVFYMGLMSNQKISQSLIKQGLSANTPTAIIQQGTNAQQRVLITQLSNMTNAVNYYKIKSPSLIIIGHVVHFATKLNWFKQGELIIDIQKTPLTQAKTKQVANY